MWLCCRSGTSSDYGKSVAYLINIDNGGCVKINTTKVLSVTVSDLSISWYSSTSAEAQLNSSGAIYYWYALG